MSFPDCDEDVRGYSTSYGISSSRSIYSFKFSHFLWRRFAFLYLQATSAYPVDSLQVPFHILCHGYIFKLLQVYHLTPVYYHKYLLYYPAHPANLLLTHPHSPSPPHANAHHSPSTTSHAPPTPPSPPTTMANSRSHSSHAHSRP